MYREHAAGAPLWIVAFNGKVFGIERATGLIRWRAALQKGPVELMIDQDLVVAVDYGTIALIDYMSGTVRKLIQRGDVAKAMRAVILVDGPHLLIGGTGEIACYTRDGEFLWDQGFTGEGYGSVSIGVPGRVRQADMLSPP
jgi:hypothetical protein